MPRVKKKQETSFCRKASPFRRNYPILTETHLPNGFHLLIMLAMMTPSRFWDLIF
jgi:hypothetical protein